MQVILTPTHLAIVMEFAAGGELFDRIVDRGRFSEDEVLYIYVIIGSSLSSYYSYPPQQMLVCSHHLLIVGQILLPAIDLWS